MRNFIKGKSTILLTILILVIASINIFIWRFGMDFIILTFAAIAIVYASYSKKTKEVKQFAKDWAPPILLFYLYEKLRAYAYKYVAIPLDRPVIIKPLIDLERKLFFFLDEVPSVKLQLGLRPEKGIANWYDSFLFFFYVMFFWYWLLAGFILWVKNRKLFRPYMYGLVTFSLIDVVVYALFPSSPPWYAADHGFIPQIYRILWEVPLLPSNGVSIVSTYGVNDFAAFPSHHAAWPFYATLFLHKHYGRKAIPLYLVPLTIAFATWYGAEHYVIDSLAGFLVAFITFVIATNWQKIIRFIKNGFRKKSKNK